MKRLILILMALGLNACSKGSSDTPPAVNAAAVSGQDLSGSYKLTNITCMNSTLSTVTSSILPPLGTYDTIVVTGNAFTENSLFSGCNYIGNGQVSATSNQLLVTNQLITSGNCTQYLTFPSGYSPATSTISFVVGQTLTDRIVAYFRNLAGDIYEQNGLSDGTSGGYCFNVFSKQ